MRWVWLAAIAGCTYAPRAGSGDGTTITIVDDTAADLAQPAQLTDGELTAEGTIIPAAYVLGGLHARAFARKLIDGNSTFAKLDTTLLTATKLGEGYGQLPADWGQSRPFGLGIANRGGNVNDDFTVVYDGELALAAGTNTIEIDPDDAALFEITIDGTPTAVLDATAGGTTSFDVVAPSAGFYPIRVAIGEAGGTARLLFRLGPASGATSTVDRARTRSRIVSTGLSANVYESLHTAFAGSTVVATADQTLAATVPPPYDIPMTGTTSYAVRYVGQIHIDVAGTWSFETLQASQDTARIWIDKTHLASKWGNGIVDGKPPVATVDLGVGWHDIFIDLAVQMSNNLGQFVPHQASLALVATPPGGAPAPVPSSQLRPVVSSGLATGTLIGRQNLVVDGVTTTNLTLADVGMTVKSIDTGFILFHADPAAYTIALEAGGASIPIPVDAASSLGLVLDDASLEGQPMPTAYTTRFTDNTAGGPFVDPTAFFPFVDVTGLGGPAMPFAPVMTYVGKAHETPDATALGRVRVAGAFDGAAVQLAVRTADTVEGLAVATFVDVANDEIATPAAAAFVQYRVVATGDGWQFPVVDKIEVDYVVP